MSRQKRQEPSLLSGEMLQQRQGACQIGSPEACEHDVLLVSIGEQQNLVCPCTQCQKISQLAIRALEANEVPVNLQVMLSADTCDSAQVSIELRIAEARKLVSSAPEPTPCSIFLTVCLALWGRLKETLPEKALKQVCLSVMYMVPGKSICAQ